MIETVFLTKKTNEQTLVQEVNMQLGGGKLYALLGNSENEKTALLDLLTGCVFPTEGEVKINGFDMQTNAEKAKSAIGYVPQKDFLEKSFTVKEYLSFLARVRGVQKQVALRQIQELTARFGLSEKIGTTVEKLTEDEKVNLSILQGLLGKSEILFLDGTFDTLSKESATEKLHFLKEAFPEKTFFYATKYLSCARLADEVLILSDSLLAEDLEQADFCEKLNENTLTIPSEEEGAEPTVLHFEDFAPVSESLQTKEIVNSAHAEDAKTEEVTD